jgi:two-component system, chemotaxis family, protein-glutamate methylesterase/glutaminase
MIVVGGSLGGCAALREILLRLPPNFPRPIAVVLHRHRTSEDLLVPVVQRGCALPVAEAEDKDPIQGGRVYLAPSDYHLLVDQDSFALSTDELVNFARPSIDVLFESAAEWRGRTLVAVVLTGSGSDGARGARRVEEAGGTVFVQDPMAAEAAWMPNAALAATRNARVLSLTEMADALVKLSARD